ncbi:WD repeat and HMG-box DNA-binding protein 1 [Neocloeon triangulifer]|uniref:WD repeat and HMG-box DNA-binding protein 1 n=1 Tax=Neocloeon triangulifer TaxID=2078957 RepID=UPI00286EB832|nr:WD repeat and HMG-box DNA-binding protein 1 [Neocloeon triangulifer]
MTLEISPTRYAHSSGHTDVCFSSDGRYILTCGTDSDVRKWCSIEDDDPQALGTKNMNAIAVVSVKDKIYVSGDDNKVAIYSLKDMTNEGILSRASAPVTCLSISSNGNTLASGGCDFNIHVTDTETFKDSLFTGHTAPILSVAIDPKGEFLASSSCDGSVRIWEISTCQKVQSWTSCFPNSNDFHASTTLARMSWEPKSGKTLAVPYEDSIKLYQRGTWNEIMSIKNPTVVQPFSIVSFSPCGRLLVATSKGGIWSLFDSASGYKLIATEKNLRGTNVTGLAWKPKEKSLAFCNFEGDLGIVTISLPDDDTPPAVEIPEPVIVDNGIEDGITSDFEMDDFEDKLLEGRAQSRMSAATVDGSVMTGQVPAVKVEASYFMQEAFQPSACPTHLQRRFMVYNNVGIVISVTDDSDTSTIDVEFHNISVHHNFSLPNIFDHSLCALTEEVLVLSGPKQESTESSKVVVQMLQGGDSSREWMVDLLPGEEAVCVAAGLGFVAVGTDEGSVRLFSIGGMQRDVISVGGKIVSMAALGKQLMVIFHAGLGTKALQNYGYVVYSIRDNSVRFAKRPQHLTVPAGCTLRWIGFTDEGNPCFLDSSGKIHVISSNNVAYVLTDTERLGEKGATSHYFLIGVNETEMKFRAILCKGAYYPPIAPRPIMGEILIQAPICDSDSAKGKLEEDYVRTKRAAYSSKCIDPSTGMPKDDDYAVLSNVKSFNTTLLKIFAMACIADMDTRAYDIYKLMTAAEWRVKARQYAHSKNKSRLLERLEDFVDQPESEEEPEIVEESQEIEPRYKILSRINSTESFGSGKETIEPMKMSKLKRALSSQRSFEMFSTPTQNGGNPFKKNAPKPPLSETLLSKNSFIEEDAEFSRSATPDSLQMDSSDVSSKHMSDFSEQSRTSLDTNSVALESPKVVEEAKAKENGSAVDGFKKWFENNKSNLQAEFPGMKLADLKKEAIKKFKAANKPAGKKRGALGKQEEPQPKKFAMKKLDAFLFKKKDVPKEPESVETPVETLDKEENTQFESETPENDSQNLTLVEDTPEN